MSFGDVLVSAVRHRVSQSGAVFAGRPVEVFVNAQGQGNDPSGMTPADLWRTQPHLRTVVDFLARNVAQLGLHAFVRDGEARSRDRESEVARVLCRRPNPYMTSSELVHDLVGNIALWNRAYWFIFEGAEGPEVHPFPAFWVAPVYGRGSEVIEYTVTPPGADKAVKVPAEKVVAFNGWSPVPGTSSSPVEALRLILEEQHHSRVHRLQVWKRNGRVGSYLTRPRDAPEWDNTARARFYRMFEAFVGDEGAKAGGTPLLEDGMELKRVGFNSADEQWSDSVKISIETVAQVYQVNPTMVGVLDAANYSNVKEFNRSLYTNTLGPLLRMIEDRLNVFVLPMLGADEGQFVEFNVAEKLRGSFEEQASVTSTAVGAPWMTRNEARKLQNLPAVDGGDELITPLNVLEGGQASPQDGGEPVDEAVKSREVVAAHVARVARVVPAKGFDEARFTRELAADLSKAGCDPSISEGVNARIGAALEAGTDLAEVAA